MSPTLRTCRICLDTEDHEVEDTFHSFAIGSVEDGDVIDSDEQLVLCNWCCRRVGNSVNTDAEYEAQERHEAIVAMAHDALAGLLANHNYRSHGWPAEAPAAKENVALVAEAAVLYAEALVDKLEAKRPKARDE